MAALLPAVYGVEQKSVLKASQESVGWPTVLQQGRWLLGELFRTPLLRTWTEQHGKNAAVIGEDEQHGPEKPGGVGCG